MRKFTIIEWVGILLIVLLILNIVGRLIGIISDLWFWVIIAVVAYLAYKKVPFWKK